ncbi:cyclic nucleotide-binding domain-containing protein [Candidatus Saganbacteria bacterium]|uniref:Cyclic nucleotide-binding domain-containing protein n=1 Tax=Candidatus Saganbacteria bacterium TaxID=2575572 RepID=A0A9D6UMT5_UNCSA|nr:cyclic nucleotide-binding domain-containing protein [Candidatus Saganbacteria bacterium]
MVTPEMLKGINLFEFLKLEELEDIAAISTIEEFNGGDYVYKEGDKAEKIYMVLEGRVAMETEIGPSRRATIYTETKGKMFGYPAMVKPHIFSTYARCLDRAKIITIRADDLVEKVFKPDCRRGYLVMNKLGEIIAQKLKETMIQLLSLVHG